MKFNNRDTAVVVIDPQNDFLSEKGTSWGLVGASVTKNGIIGNMERLFKSAKANDYGCLSPPIIFIQQIMDGKSTVHLKLWK